MLPRGRRQFSSDAAFVHLKGIHTLLMWQCWQPDLTDAALAHLRGIHSLAMENCDQAAITEAGMAHLKGIAPHVFALGLAKGLMAGQLPAGQVRQCGLWRPGWLEGRCASLRG